MIGLHRVLRAHPDALEADLLRFYQVDLLDYWRTPRTLSTRRLLVLWRHIPRGQGAAVHAVRDRWDDWSIEAELTDYLRRTVVAVNSKDGDPGAHPFHPSKRREIDPRRKRKLAEARERAAERRRAIEAGEIT